MKDERILQTTALYCLAIMIIVVFVGIAIKYKEHQRQEPIGSLSVPTSTPLEPTSMPMMNDYTTPDIHANIEADWSVWNVLLTEQKEELDGILGNKSIIIRKPENITLSLSISANTLKHSIQVQLSGADKCDISPISILRINGEKYYIGLPESMLASSSVLSDEESYDIGQPKNEIIEECTNGDLLTSLTIDWEEQNSAQITTFSFVTDGYYIPEVHETPEYYIIALRRPKDLYQKIVVIDAGHGGNDPGAGAENWTITEADLNLKMTLYLKEYLDADTEIKAYYTRTDNSYPTLAERVELANGVGADLFISIHCNSTVRSQSNGSAVMYNAEQGLENEFNSKELARLCLTNLLETLGTNSVGIIKRPDLHIIRRAQMPVVMIETAYMSNPKDLRILKDDANLKAIGETLYHTILQAYSKMEQDSIAD